MATAVIDISINAKNRAERELLQLNRQLHGLNRQLYAQKQAYAQATGEERKNVAAKIQTIRNLQQQTRFDQQQLRLKKQLILQQRRENGVQSEFVQNMKNVVRGQNDLISNLQRVGQVAVRTSSSYGGFIESVGSTAFVFNLAGFYLGRFVSDIVRVGAEAERFQSVLRVTTQNASAVETEIRKLNRELILTDFATITSAFNALNAATGNARTSIEIIRGLGTAMGTLNTAAYDQQRFFTQLSQLYAQNRLELDDYKILQETLPQYSTHFKSGIEHTDKELRRTQKHVRILKHISPRVF